MTHCNQNLGGFMRLGEEKYCPTYLKGKWSTSSKNGLISSGWPGEPHSIAILLLGLIPTTSIHLALVV